MKDSRVWRAGLLAGLLSLSWWSLAAEPVVPATGGEMETVSQVPEGYRPLPVTEFVVDAEKNDTYILSFGVQDEAIMQEDWILTKHIRGHLVVYNPSDSKVLYNITVSGKRTLPGAAFSFPYNKAVHRGFFYYLELKKGQYLIRPELFILNGEIKEPDILLSFRRKKFVW